MFENRRDGIKVGEHETKVEPLTARTEPENAKVLLPCLVKPMTLANEGLDRKRQVILDENWDFICMEHEEQWHEILTEGAEFLNRRERNLWKSRR